MTDMKVTPGMFVEYTYKLLDAADGRLLFEATAKHPDEMIFGVSQDVVPGLAHAMEGLGKGDRFEVTMPPEAAFGMRNEDDIVELERGIFERDGELAEEVEVGAVLPMMTAEGYRIMGTILEIGDKMVRMDFNHPFAGKTVTFKGEVVNVREATSDELHPAAGGCGGCCGGGSCHDGGCGDGCGEGGCHDGGCCK